MKRHLFLFALMIVTVQGFLFAMHPVIPKTKFEIVKNRILKGRELNPSDYDDTRYDLPIDNKTLLILLIEAHSNNSVKNKEFNSLLKKFGHQLRVPFSQSGTTHLTSKDMNAGLLAHIYQVGEPILITAEQTRYCTPVAIHENIAYLRHSLKIRDTEFVTELKDFSDRLPIITSYNFDEARQRVNNILEKFQR